MKKIMSLLAVIILIFSFGCSNDNDDNPKQDLIIGVWKPVKAVEVYKDGSENIDIPNECAIKSRYTFKADGSFFETIYDYYGKNCKEIVGGFYSNGRWIKISETTYELILICNYPEFDESITKTWDEVIFSNSNNTMIVRFNVTDPEDNLDYCYVELSRVE